MSIEGVARLVVYTIPQIFFAIAVGGVADYVMPDPPGADGPAGNVDAVVILGEVIAQMFVVAVAAAALSALVIDTEPGAADPAGGVVFMMVLQYAQPKVGAKINAVVEYFIKQVRGTGLAGGPVAPRTPVTAGSGGPPAVGNAMGAN